MIPLAKRERTLYGVLIGLAVLIPLLLFVAYTVRRNQELQTRLDAIEQQTAKRETFRLKGRNWNKEATVANAVILGVLLGDVPGVLEAHGIRSIKDADGNDYPLNPPEKNAESP